MGKKPNATVFDKSALRLRSSETRRAPKRKTLKNLRSTVHDSRGNVLAVDAGGSLRVPKYRNVAPRASDDQEETIDIDIPASPSEKAKGKRKAVNLSDSEPASDSDKRKPSKRKKRQPRVEEDLDFLDSPPTSQAQSSSSPLNKSNISPLFTQNPSSELLTAIHHFASNYYYERGQNINASREFRRQRKDRQIAKAEVEQDPEDGHEDDSTVGELSLPKSPRRARLKRMERGPRGWAQRGWQQDMYRVMDGSALMAIGMLVQTYVGLLMEPEKPHGWDDPVVDNDDEESEPTLEAEPESEVESEDGMDVDEGEQSEDELPHPDQLLS